MKRRTFATELLGALLAVSFGARAAKPRLAHIGILSPSRTGIEADALVEALRQFGYVDGQSALIEWQVSEGDGATFARLAGDLVLHKVDIIVAIGSEATEGAKQATHAIPIVFSTGDPIGAGFVESLARPGGNLTGFTLQQSDLAAKYLQLVREVLPDAAEVVVLWSPANPSMARFVHDAQSAAPQLAFRVRGVAFHDAASLEEGLVAIERGRPRAMIVLAHQLILEHERRISEFALRNRIVTLASAKRLAAHGLLMFYGSSLAEGTRQVADYVDKILKGARPAKLPVQQPTKFELVINLRTAKAIGISLPPSLLSRADEVIE